MSVLEVNGSSEQEMFQLRWHEEESHAWSWLQLGVGGRR